MSDSMRGSIPERDIVAQHVLASIFQIDLLSFAELELIPCIIASCP
jgi:hypothetical protein